MENRAFPRELPPEMHGKLGCAGVTAVIRSRACLRLIECAERRMRVVPRRTFIGLSSPSHGDGRPFFRSPTINTSLRTSAHTGVAIPEGFRKLHEIATSLRSSQ